MPDGGKHRNISRTVGKGARLGQINPLMSCVLADTARFLVLRQQWRKYPPGSDMVFELQSVTNDFFEAEVERNRPNREIQSSGYENIAVTQFTSRIDQRLCLRKD